MEVLKHGTKEGAKKREIKREAIKSREMGATVMTVQSAHALSRSKDNTPGTAATSRSSCGFNGTNCLHESRQTPHER